MPKLKGLVTDLHNRRIFPGEISIEQGKILAIEETNEPVPQHYIMPGFVDAHIHIESSMLVPSEFARLAVQHGTVATVSDPHEIANVCGMEGVDFMIENGNTVPLKFFFGAPSCVPATPFETAGAALDVAAVERLLDRDEILYLAEMMNWPGVLNRDADILAKIKASIDRGKPVDGHAPGLTGDLARHYAAAGISTDHECMSREEALDKIRAGMLIAIREGSAARNYEALHTLLDDHPDHVMFCSDDKHPDDLIRGHMNSIAARSVAYGHDVFDTLRAICVKPVEHYSLSVGLLRRGDPADFVVVDNLQDFNVMETWIDGNTVFKNGEVRFERPVVVPVNHFTSYKVHPGDFAVPAWGAALPIDSDADAYADAHPDADAESACFRGEPTKSDAGLREERNAVARTSGKDAVASDFQTPISSPTAEVRHIIIAHDGEIVTGGEQHALSVVQGHVQPDIDKDILKVAVVNRYQKAPVSVAFIKNFGIKRGAIASSVAHDSHNIIAVGSSDEDLSRVVNLIMAEKGGIAAVTGDQQNVVGLPVAGIMSVADGEAVAKGYERLTEMAREMGSTIQAPFMLISFMALLVIPKLKLSDKGLFDGESFSFV